MSPVSSKARMLTTTVGLIKAGGQFCIVCVVVTGCFVGFWRFAGSEIGDKFIQGMLTWRDTTIAMSEASKANLEAMKLAKRMTDKAMDVLDVNRVSHLPEQP